jgi:hypothetical protein
MSPRRASTAALVARLALALLGAGLLGGCVTPFDTNRDLLRQFHQQGQYDQAARTLDDPRTKDLYTGKNQLLYWLDRGAVALALDDTQTTVDLLEKAESYMEVRREPTAGDEFARWLLNDTAAPYYGEPYEDIYVNVLKMLARLERGEIGGGATVEARRMAGKADVLRDRYVRTARAVEDKARSSSARLAPASGLVDVNAEGEFLESTLGTYLTALAFMKDGDAASQSVAGRRLQSSLRLQSALQSGVDPSRFDGLGELSPSAVNVLFVGLSGRAPHKVAQRVGPIPLYEWPVYFELPQLVGGSQEVARVRVIAEPVSGGPARDILLDKIEDMRAVALENHRRQLPQIYFRTLLRSQLKAAAAFAATQGVKNSASRGSSRDAAQIGMILAGLAFVTLTEKADLRAWTFLPGRADVGAVKLEPGEHRVRLVFQSAAGATLYTSPERTIRVDPASPGELTTLVEHFWR